MLAAYEQDATVSVHHLVESGILRLYYPIRREQLVLALGVKDHKILSAVPGKLQVKFFQLYKSILNIGSYNIPCSRTSFRKPDKNYSKGANRTTGFFSRV